MYEQVEKRLEKQGQSAVKMVFQRRNRNGSTYRFADNRPEDIQIRKLKELTKNYPQVANANSITQNKCSEKKGFGVVDDRQGASILRSRDSLIQRQVRNFDTQTTSVDTPAEQVKKQVQSSSDIDYTKFTLDTALSNKKLNIFGSRSRVDSLRATMKYGRPNGDPSGGGTDTSEVGHLGTQEDILRHNVYDRGFEGGHLVTHALWDDNDAQKADRNRYGNLVPMSRSVNIDGWAGIENEFETPNWRRWQIAPNNQIYKLREGLVAERLGLPLKLGKNGDAELTFNSWIPLSINAQQTAAGGLNFTTSELATNQIVETVDDGPSLVQLLKNQGLWEYLKSTLQVDVANL